MKALVTRVSEAEIIVNNTVISAVKEGVVVFLGVEKGDQDAQALNIAKKIANLRIFENEEGKLHYSVKEKGYEVLCISNFTLCAKIDKGRRPSFEQSMVKEEADKLFDNFTLLLEGQGLKVKKGVFGEHMDIKLNMDGPVNIIIENN
ncbi:MAG: D-tyrosyl-tRNA(Tyr) deacylase [Candidatus Omnitrophota bacterium]|nr:MAG: D-tyrosyl-tRNA(Tyr) deacylase [Candidatus Omnitrophota bacterium]